MKKKAPVDTPSPEKIGTGKSPSRWRAKIFRAEGDFSSRQARELTSLRASMCMSEWGRGVWLLVLFILWTSIGLGQQLTFQKLYTINGLAFGSCGLLCNDNGYIIASSAISIAWSDEDVYLVRTDSLGNVLWRKTYGDAVDNIPRSIQQTNDGGYIVGCCTYTSSGNDDFLLLKIDSIGNLLWQKTYSNSSLDDFLMETIQTSDGGYIMVGETEHNIPWSIDAFVIKTDSIGNVIWNKRIDDGVGHDWAISVIQTSDGGYVVGGERGISQGNPPYYFWLFKMDALGNILWENTYGTGRVDKVRKTLDGGYIMAGTSLGNYIEVYLVKTDSSGIPQWEKLFKRNQSIDEAYDIIPTNDSGFVLTGRTDGGIGNFLLKTDKNGDSLWVRNYKGVDGAETRCVFKTRDSGFAVIGTSIDASQNTRSIYFIKTDSIGHSDCNEDNAIFTDSTTSTFATVFSSATSVFTSVYSPPYLVDSGGVDTILCFSGLPISMCFADSLLCPGTCTSFLNLSTNATTYQWNFPGAAPNTSTATNPTNICYANPGSYDVQLIASNANGSDTLLLTNYITVYPAPPPQSITQSGDTLFANAGAASYQWYFNTTIINGATNYFYVAPASGDYNVVCTDANGCEVEAAVFNVIAASPTQPPRRGGVEIHPNPVVDKFTIQKLEVTSGTAVEIIIYNMLGVAVQQEARSQQQEAIIDISQLPSGMYWLKVGDGKKIFRSKFVKQ